ncbi:hypothetical protein [Shimazuella kribbensis]|uniref:hypothetical protein n=1 Tax=Shimazuella kribbensis TaxID=139808 RepID=UPI00041814D7|nr:hypothetical protein [Shimazuella kribbensis]
MGMVKSFAKKFYRGLLFIVLLAVLMLCTILFITFLADPSRMIETIKGTFGIT